VRILIDLLDHPNGSGGRTGADGEPIHVTLPTELVVRQSTGPPPGS
jgi:hypothetical protein